MHSMPTDLRSRTGLVATLFLLAFESSKLSSMTRDESITATATNVATQSVPCTSVKWSSRGGRTGTAQLAALAEERRDLRAEQALRRLLFRDARFRGDDVRRDPGTLLDEDLTCCLVA